MRCLPTASTGRSIYRTMLPVTDRATVDMHELRIRVVPDAAGAQAHCCLSHLRQSASLAAEIDRHAFDVKTVARHAGAVSLHPSIGGRRAVAGDYQERIP